MPCSRVIAYRGEAGQVELPRGYVEHVRRISQEKDGIVLLLTDQDLRVFIRQAISGEVKDAHIQDKYDRMVRAIS